jgi:hypothetical protein
MKRCGRDRSGGSDEHETVPPIPWGSVLLPEDSSKFEWSLLDRSELWRSIVRDVAIHLDDRQAALAAALRGERES